jgi:hypothetical protein
MLQKKSEQSYFISNHKSNFLFQSLGSDTQTLLFPMNSQLINFDNFENMVQFLCTGYQARSYDFGHG